MSVALLIVSHHNIGKALVEAMETTFDHRLPLKLHTVDVPADGDPDKLKLEVKNAVKAINTGEGVLILTDLYGSTPSNICKDNLQTGHVRIVTGLNLPMLLRVMNYPDLPLDAIAANAIAGGQGLDCLDVWSNYLFLEPGFFYYKLAHEAIETHHFKRPIRLLLVVLKYFNYSIEIYCLQLSKT